MHLGLTTSSSSNEDRSWMTNADTHEQVSGSINPSDAKWVEADHYPDGDIPSGVALAWDSGTSRYIPFDSAGSGDETNFAGFLYNTTPVTAAIAATASVGVPVMVLGFVSLDALPTNGSSANGGLGADVEAARAAIRAGAPATNMIWIGA